MRVGKKASSWLLGLTFAVAAFGVAANPFVVGYGGGTDLHLATQDAIANAEEQCNGLGYPYAIVQSFNTQYQFGYYFVEANAVCV